ncbi:MAG: Ig-like domain-containing protein, partial [Chloroflexota bacterium]
MLYSRRERKTFPLNRWLTLAIIGVTVVGGIAAWLTSPRIESITPEGGDISSLTPITIRFTQSMNRSSVENHFHIEPKIEGAFSWIENQMTFTPSSEWKAGAVRVTFDSGATSESGLPMLVGRSWQFNVTAPRIAFLFKINEVVNLWVYPIGTEELIQMTKEGNGVGEYAISPDGTQIVYSALRKDGGADLKRVSRDGTNVSDLVSCPNELCAFPVFSFDGKMLAFERTPLKQTATRIEVIEAATAKTVTPILDPNYITRTPFFARDG